MAHVQVQVVAPVQIVSERPVRGDDPPSIDICNSMKGIWIALFCHEFGHHLYDLIKKKPRTHRRSARFYIKLKYDLINGSYVFISHILLLEHTPFILSEV